MKRVLLVLLAVNLLCFNMAWAEELSTEELRLAAAQEYPDWQIWKVNKYAARQWKEEMTDHCEIGLFRMADEQLEFKQLHALLDPLKKGDKIPWEIADWAKVPLAEEAVQRISNMPSSKIYDEYCPGFVFDKSILPGCATFLLEEGMRWAWLAAYPDYLIGVAIHPDGLQSVRIACWDGDEYVQTVFSPAQQAAFDINGAHSFNDYMEIDTDSLELSFRRDSAGVWQLDAINNGSEIFTVGQHGIVDITYGENGQNNNARHYGQPLFPVTLEAFNITEIPSSIEEALLHLDAEGYACTKSDDAALYDAPEGKLLADCFARVVGQVKEVRENWVCLQIGDSVHGLTGWFHRDELAFGKEIENVICSFPSYNSEESKKEHLINALPGLSVPLDEYDNAVWLIGQAPDGRWLVEVNEQQVLFAQQDAFTDIGSTEGDG